MENKFNDEEFIFNIPSKPSYEELEEENKQLKEKLERYKNIVEEINQEIEWVKDLVDTCELVDTNAITIYKIIQKYEKSDSNE